MQTEETNVLRTVELFDQMKLLYALVDIIDDEQISLAIEAETRWMGQLIGS